MNAGSVEATLTLIDQMTPGLQRAMAQVAAYEARIIQMQNAVAANAASHKQGASAVDRFTSSIKTTLIHVATAAVAYKTLSAAISSIGDAVEFERAMVKIANVTSITDRELSTFRANIDAMRRESGRGPQELAEGLYAVASSVDDAAVATQILANASKLAAIGLGETDDIARALASGVNAYGAANLSAAQASDQLLVAVRLGGAEAAEFAGALGRVVPLAAQMDISFAEVNASVATFTRLGVGADEAVTALRGTMVALLNPTEKGRETLAQYGMTFEDLRVSVKEKGLAETLIQLKNTVGDNDEALQKIIPNVRALAGFLANTGEQAGAYRDILRQVKVATGETDEANAKFQASVAGQWDQLKAGLEAFSIRLGEALLPAILDVAQAFSTAFPGDGLIGVAEDIAVLISQFADLVRAIGTVMSWLDQLKAKFAELIPGASILFEMFSGVGHLGGIGILSKGISAVSEALNSLVEEGGDGLNKMTTQAASFRDRMLEVAAAIKSADLAKVVAAQHDLTSAVASTSTAMNYWKNQIDDLMAAQARAAASGDVTDWKKQSAALTEAQRQYNRLNISVGQTRVLLDEATVAARDLFAASNNPVPAPPGSIGDPKLANRYDEAIAKIRDQIALAQETMRNNAKLHNERLAQLRGEATAHEEINLEAQIALRVNAEIRRQEDDKVRLTDAQIVNIRRYVTQLVIAEQKIKDQVRAFTALEKMYQIIGKEVVEWQQELNKIIATQVKVNGAVMAASATNSYAYRNTQLQNSLDLTRDMFDAWVTGGGKAARIEEVLLELRETNTGATYEQAEALVAVEEQEQKLLYWIEQIAAVSKPTWVRFAELALDAIDLVVDTFASALSQMLKDGEVNWKDLWGNLVDSAIDMFVKMLADMLKQWLVTQAAMAASDYAGMGSGGGGNMKGGGGKDFLGSAGSMAGMGGGGSTGGFVSSSGVGGASWSTVGIAAFWVAFVAYAGYMAGVWGKKGKDFYASGTIGGTGTDMSITDTGGTDLKNVTNRLGEVIEGIKDFLKVTDIQMDAIADVTLAKIGHTYTAWVDTIHGRIQPGFATAEEAMEWVSVAAIKYGDFADSVSELMRTVITNSKAMNREQLAADIEFARMLEGLSDMGMSEGETALRNSLSAAVEQFFTDIQRAQQLLGTNSQMFMDAVEKLGFRLVKTFQDAYNNLLGIKATPEDTKKARQAEAIMFNAQKKLAIAEMTLRKLEMESKIQFLLGQERLAQAQGQIYQANLDAMAAYVEALGIILGELIKIPDIDINDPRLFGGKDGGKGGGGRDIAGDKADLRAMLFAAQASDYANAVQAIMDKWKEAEILAHGDAELLAEINRQRQIELDLLKQQAILSARERFRQFTGVNNDPFAQLRRSAQEAVDAIQESPMANWEKAAKIAAIWASLGEQIEKMADEMTMNLMGGLMSDLEKYGISYEQMEEMKLAFAKLEWKLKLENYKAEFELLKAKKLLNEDEIRLIGGAIDALQNVDWAAFMGGGSTASAPNWMGGYEGDRDEYMGHLWEWVAQKIETGVNEAGETWVSRIAAHWRDLGAIPGSGGGQGGSGSGGIDPAAEADKARERALKMLEDWSKLGVHPLIRDLNEWAKDVEFLKTTLGDTAEVAAAAAKKYADIINRYLDPIREYLAGMTFASGSTVSGEDQFFAAQQQFRDMFAALSAGDLTQLDNVTEFAELYRTLAQGFTGGEGLRFIEKEIRDTLAAILGTVPGVATAPMGSPSNPTVTANPALVEAVQLGNTLLLAEARTANEHHAVTNTKLQHIAVAVSNPLSVRYVQ